jgi:hypothetical protein
VLYGGRKRVSEVLKAKKQKLSILILMPKDPQIIFYSTFGTTLAKKYKNFSLWAIKMLPNGNKLKL